MTSFATAAAKNHRLLIIGVLVDLRVGLLILWCLLQTMSQQKKSLMVKRMTETRDGNSVVSLCAQRAKQNPVHSMQERNWYKDCVASTDGP